MRNSKSRASRSHLNLSKSSQGKLPDAVANTDTEYPPNRREKSPVSKDLGDDAVPIDRLPAKRPRLTRTRVQQPRTEVEELEQADKTTLQPKLNSPNCPDASSPESEVDGPDRVSPASNGKVNEHQPKQAQLTRKNLAWFNEMARKKGSNKASAWAPAESAVGSATTRTTSTTTSGFAIQAYKNGILDDFKSKPPTNLEDIQKRHAQSRGTASPTLSAYEDYVDKVGHAGNEATIVIEASGKLLKEYPKGGYTRAFNRAFTAFPKDVGFNNGLSVPQPDFVEGLRMEEYDPFPVDEHVSGAVLYKDDPYSVTLSHLAGEWKGPDGKLAEAKLQSRFDGAALVYARDEALSLIGKRDPPGHAEVKTFATDGTNINFFAHFAAPSEDGTLQYHQYQYASTNIKDTYQGHKDGRRGLRNDQDYAKEQSYILRDQLKEYWKQRNSALQPIAEGAPMPMPGAEPLGTTNAHEDEDDDKDEAGYEVVEKPYQLTPPGSSKPSRKHGNSEQSASHSVSSRSLSPANDYDGGGGKSPQKRKASLSQECSEAPPRHRSKGKDYWELDAGSGS